MATSVSSILPGASTWAQPMGDDINQKIAFALMQKQFGQNPPEIKSHWQGAAELANSALAGMMYRKAEDQQMGAMNSLGGVVFPGSSPAPQSSGFGGSPIGGFLGKIGSAIGLGGGDAPTSAPSAPPQQVASLPPPATDATPDKPNYGGIASALADKQMPPRPPADIPNVSQGTPSPDAMNPVAMQDQTPPLSGGNMPSGVDRSRFAAEIQQNPALSKRMADMVNGEVGLKDPKLAQIELESALNRAQLRGIPLDQALLSVGQDRKRGYYASDTYSRPVNQQQFQNFQQNVLSPVMAGSDVGTQFLGSPVTGNASQMGFAGRRLAQGAYANGKWYSGVPGRGEMFVTEKSDAGKHLPTAPIVPPQLLAGPTDVGQDQPSAMSFAPVASNDPSFLPQGNADNIATNPMGQAAILNSVQPNPGVIGQPPTPSASFPPQQTAQLAPPVGGGFAPSQFGNVQNVPTRPVGQMPPQMAQAQQPPQMAQNGPPVPPPQQMAQGQLPPPMQPSQPQAGNIPALQEIDRQLSSLGAAYQRAQAARNPIAAQQLLQYGMQLQQKRLELSMPQVQKLGPGERLIDARNGQVLANPDAGLTGMPGAVFGGREGQAPLGQGNPPQGQEGLPNSASLPSMQGGPAIPVQAKPQPDYVPRDPSYGGLTLPGHNAADSIRILHQAAAQADLSQRGAGQAYRDQATALEGAIAKDTEYFRKGQETLFTKGNEGIGESIQNAQKAGDIAWQKMQNLGVMRAALEHSPDGITTGPAAGAIVKAKQFFHNIGLLGDDDLKNLNDTEIASKVGFGLASQTVKAITSRPTQMEVGMALQNNPGILMTPEGSKLMMDVLGQQANQEADLSRMAYNKGNWNDWGNVVANYYKTHPIMSPYDHTTPLGVNDIARISQSGGSITRNAPQGPQGSPQAAPQQASPGRQDIEQELRRRGLLK